MSAPKSVVIVGGGLGGLRTAQALRKLDFEGNITIAAAEEHLPYDRPPLSKGVLTGEVDIGSTGLVRPDALAAARIDLLAGTPAESLDLDKRLVRVAGGQLPFDALVIATGASPVIPEMFRDLRGVYPMRTLEDARLLSAHIRAAERVCVIGAGFIGLEVASSAKKIGVDTTVIELAPRPLGRVLGAWAGEYCGQLHVKEGVRLRCGARVTRARQIPGDAVALEFADGTAEEYDLVVLGTGVRPNTTWLADSGLTVDNGVVCDEFLCAGTTGVHAVGDVARWPNGAGGLVRQEQWTNTVQQARAVAHNIVHPDERRRYTSSGYFWSDQHGLRVQSVGDCTGSDAAIVQGSREADSFLSWFFRDDHLVGAFAVAQPRLFMKSMPLVERALPKEMAHATLDGWAA